MSQAVADNVLAYYEDNEQDFVVIRAHAECVHGRDKNREFRRK